MSGYQTMPDAFKKAAETVDYGVKDNGRKNK